MPEFSFVLLHVASPPASAAFYERLLGQAPIEASPSFVMMKLRDGVMLGLWQRDTVAPAVTAPPGCGEIAFTVADADAVRAVHGEWTARGAAILQPPTVMDFGTTFTAADPDGNRLRVLAPA